MLQRLHQVAVVVHHAKKGANRLRDGQAVRDSSEFHASGDLPDQSKVVSSSRRTVTILHGWHSVVFVCIYSVHVRR